MYVAIGNWFCGVIQFFLQTRWSAGCHKLFEHGNWAARKWRDREEIWRARGRGEKKSERRECFGGNLPESIQVERWSDFFAP